MNRKKKQKLISISLMGALMCTGLVGALVACAPSEKTDQSPNKKAPPKQDKDTNKINNNTNSFKTDDPDPSLLAKFDKTGTTYDPDGMIPVPKEFADSNKIQVKYGNQQINGKILGLEDPNELMFFGYYKSIGNENGRIHTHPHIIQPIETRLLTNEWFDEDWNENNPYIAVPKDTVIDKNKGVLKNVRIYYPNNPRLGNLVFDDFIFRVDGVGSSSRFVKKPTKFDDQWRYVQVDVQFDPAYLIDKKAIRITALSFVHAHGDEVIGAELTIQFKDPIKIKVVDTTNEQKN
ncbi:hypothetical protein OF377_01580 [Ureaplasma sp. ES3154-GEN]|uniref:hypothetical protein n=1 Tax=Ureaplasma sp. ES3154-GEN TaxID=2984844 RepID=UPI0021E99916|nr:hypothetical protein [Ureaplasma sp. ES3154-GEN]MCV3743577.1 hypothetical protein [Ureaplasma sp. ES3154-GEN]